MTAEKILFAMTDIEDTYLRDAQNAMGYGPAVTRRISGWKRALLVAAALLLLAAASFTTVLAADPEFREKVFGFFQISRTPLPEDAAPMANEAYDGMFVQDSFRMGETIAGQYVHAPSDSHARHGVYFLCTDPEEMQQGSHYDAYYEKDGEFVRLENHDFRQTYTLYGCTVSVEGTWAEWDGNTFFTWLPAESPIRCYNQYDKNPQRLVEFDLTLQNAQGETYGTVYPALVDLRTGALTDVLAGTQAHTVPHIEKTYITPDHTKMLLVQHMQMENPSAIQLLYADLVQHQLYHVDELSGQHADACILIDDVLTCWQTIGKKVQIWTIDLHTLARTELYPAQTADGQTPDAEIRYLKGFNRTNYGGDLSDGAHFAVLEDSAHNVLVLDLKTGERTRVPGLDWPQDAEEAWAIASPDGEKLLLYAGETDTAPAYMGLLDFSEKRYLELAVTEQEAQKAGPPEWFTNDAVMFHFWGDSSAYGVRYHVYRLHEER